MGPARSSRSIRKAILQPPVVSEVIRESRMFSPFCLREHLGAFRYQLDLYATSTKDYTHSSIRLSTDIHQHFLSAPDSGPLLEPQGSTCLLVHITFFHAAESPADVAVSSLIPWSIRQSGLRIRSKDRFCTIHASARLLVQYRPAQG